MSHRVVVTTGAQRDLADIHRWIVRETGEDGADAFLDRLTARIDGLETFPARGAIPPELERIGLANVRQAAVDPYRLFYTIEGDMVVIFAIVHARRDLRSALEHRLLKG